MNLIGHGEYRNGRFYLVLENDDFSSKEISLERIISLTLEKMKNMKKVHKIEVIFLNLCHSYYLGQVLIDLGLAKHVICTTSPINDDIASNTSSEFW